MTVDTKSASGRREVHYNSLDEVLADAERLASSEVRTVGNWTLGQIFTHLAAAMNSAIDGTDVKFPWVLKKIMGLFLKKEKILRNPISPGFKIPRKGHAQFLPEESVSTEAGLNALRTAIERSKTESQRADHPLFGPITRSEWDQFNLRHAELHMSFANSELTGEHP